MGRVQNEDIPLLLYFRSDNCGPCVTQARFLDQLTEKWPGDLKIEKIDTDSEPETARHYGVFTLPTTILVDKLGKVREVNCGLTNCNKLAQQLSGL
jgi:thioredoxin 1